MKLIQFGETVEGYKIPVLNEREIRAAAGLLFLLMFISIVMVIVQWKFTPLKYATTLFFADILIRVFINPKYAPTLILGRLIVRNQTPEYVGAPQKMFAWVIGLLMATTMFITLVLFNIHNPINGLICMTCLIFLFFESAFGICLGCLAYKLIKGKKAQYCPGEVCDPKKKHAIQTTSGAQFLVIVGFALLLISGGFTFKDHFKQEPTLAMGMAKPPHLQ